ncbi:unnamed protein product [Zymoseptoria tritici ST99CH_3D1]|nr:unnamed protein product [Zymoseptoria tritici ST99CH_3D1]
MYRLPRAFRLRQQQPLISRTTPSIHIARVPQRRTIFLKSRHQTQPIQLQAVRFRKPSFFAFSRQVRVLLWLGVPGLWMLMFSQYFSVEIVDDSKADSKKPASSILSEGDDEEEEEESFFIPMTWAVPVAREFYKGSDPEWQEFVRIAKDKPRHQKIQTDLAQMVHAGSMKHPRVAAMLGKDSKIGKYWLDISFPDGPPQEFERKGLEIGDDGIYWSAERISPEDQHRLKRALVPTAAASSLYASVSVFTGIQYRRLKQWLGWEGVNPMSPEERYKHAIEMFQRQQNGRDGNGGSAQKMPQPGPDAAASTSATSPDANTTPEPSPSISKTLPWLPLPSVHFSSDPSSSSDIPIALSAFATTLKKQWNPKKQEPPRGTFVVQGLVEVRGAKGGMLFDVKSCYDPKAGKFVVVNANLRSFKRWNQAPRGGP